MCFFLARGFIVVLLYCISGHKLEKGVKRVRTILDSISETNV